MDKLYKNITKKDIIIIYNGKKIVVKPNSSITGPDSFGGYRGLLKINKKTQPAHNNLNNDIKVSEIHEYDINPPEETFCNSDNIMIEYTIVNQEYTKTNIMKKIDLTDVTFTIPLCIESEDRKNNLTVTLDYLTNYFKTNIFICEYSDKINIKSFWKESWNESCKLFFIESKNRIFHKTKILNDLAKLTKTPIIVSYDCDVLLYPRAYIDAAKEIRNNSSDFCYPFNKPLRHISKPELPILNKILNLESIVSKTTVIHNGVPPGGCLFMNRQKFFELGMENEKMIAWGPEDQERLERIKKLDYKIKSLDNELFHLDHTITQNSWHSNPFYSHNEAEFEKIKKMSKLELQNYIQQEFIWCKQ